MIKKEYQNSITEVKYVTFKKEWNDSETHKMNNALENLFLGELLTDHRGNTKKMRTFEDIELFFGLPYTSSGEYAGVWNTNTEYHLDIDKEYNINGFVIGEDDNIYIISTDKEENEKVYKILL